MDVSVIVDHINTVSLFLSFNPFLLYYFYARTPPMSWDRHDLLMLKSLIRSEFFDLPIRITLSKKKSHPLKILI